MPKLLSRSKHEEFESNSAFQIRNQEERIAENRGNWFLRALCILRIVPPAPCFPAVTRFCCFVTIFGFSPFYPCCNHLCLDCMVFHLVCKAI